MCSRMHVEVAIMNLTPSVSCSVVTLLDGVVRFHIKHTQQGSPVSSYYSSTNVCTIISHTHLFSIHPHIRVLSAVYVMRTFLIWKPDGNVY